MLIALRGGPMIRYHSVHAEEAFGRLVVRGVDAIAAMLWTFQLRTILELVLAIVFFHGYPAVQAKVYKVIGQELYARRAYFHKLQDAFFAITGIQRTDPRPRRVIDPSLRDTTSIAQRPLGWDLQCHLGSLYRRTPKCRR